jgi:Tol biopolymer transport system component
MKRPRIAVAVAAAMTFVATVAGPAVASFPGQDTIAFVRYDGSEYRVIEMQPDGDGKHTIVGPETERVIYGAAMSPNGERVAFTRSVGEQLDLFVKRVGAGTNRITNTPNRNEFSPMWTPDGQQIVYMETDNSTYSAIVRRDRDGTHRREIDSSGEGYLYYPVVSPNGNRVLYCAPRPPTGPARGIFTYDLVTRKLDGTDRDWITGAVTNEYAGDWSPDGERVVYIAEEATKMAPGFGGSLVIGAAPQPRGIPGQGVVYSKKADGSGRRLVSDRPGIAGRVIYTPNGKRVVYSRLADVTLDLYSTPVDGGGEQRLTQTLETYNAFDLLQLLPT